MMQKKIVFGFRKASYVLNFCRRLTSLQQLRKLSGYSAARRRLYIIAKFLDDINNCRLASWITEPIIGFIPTKLKRNLSNPNSDDR